MRIALSYAAVVSTMFLLITHGFVIVSGQSMQPTLALGDVAVYRRTTEVPVDGIAVFTRETGSLVVHRVVGVGERGALRTRGDANSSADTEPVPRQRVRGRVVLRIPFGVLARDGARSLCYTSQSVAQ